MAAVKFVSYVEQGENGDWYINLTDTYDKRAVRCNTMDEYKKNIEDMGSEYGNDIEVQWIKSKHLTPKNIEDLLDKMAKMQEEYQEEITKMYDENKDESGFNPNG